MILLLQGVAGRTHPGGVANIRWSHEYPIHSSDCGDILQSLHISFKIDDLAGLPLGRVREVRDVLTFKGIVTLVEQWIGPVSSRVQHGQVIGTMQVCCDDYENPPPLPRAGQRGPKCILIGCCTLRS